MMMIALLFELANHVQIGRYQLETRLRHHVDIDMSYEFFAHCAATVGNRNMDF